MRRARAARPLRRVPGRASDLAAAAAAQPARHGPAAGAELQGRAGPPRALRRPDAAAAAAAVRGGHEPGPRRDACAGRGAGVTAVAYPATGETAFEVEPTGEAGAREHFERAREAQRAWHDLGALGRGAKLEEAARRIAADDGLVDLIV